MLIWNGWGFLVVVVGFGCPLLAELGVESAFNDAEYYQNHSWPKFVGFVTAAAIVGPIGWLLNRRRTTRELVDPNTGERVVLRTGGNHSLFFIPMEYWAPLLVLIGVAMLFVG